MKNCNIGGQAIIEGVMMRSKTSMAMAARDPNGEIESTVISLKSPTSGSMPVVRGVTNLIDMMKSGLETLSWSVKVATGEEEEPSAFEKKLAKLTGKKIDDIVMILGIVVSLALFVGLFILLPTLLRGFFNPIVHNYILRNLIEGVIRIIIFVLYLVLISQLKDIKRVFMYHGAEHKVINCYEKEQEMTPEAAIKNSRLHPRCGTSFLLIVMIISILIYALFDFNFPWWGRLLTRLALLPVVAGVSYEFLKLVAKGDSWFVRALRWPGLQLQRLTTKEPTLDMVEVSLYSFNLVLQNDAKPVTGQATITLNTGIFDDSVNEVCQEPAQNGIEPSEIGRSGTDEVQ